jgi:hypothetical protein
MIDTDKYEGHLIDKAVEDNSQVWVWKNWMLKNAETIEQHRATAALLNDAPLLLAEVKRLRKQLLRGVEMMNMTPNQTKEGRRNRAKRFEREVRKMIE